MNGLVVIIFCLNLLDLGSTQLPTTVSNVISNSSASDPMEIQTNGNESSQTTESQSIESDTFETPFEEQTIGIIDSTTVKRPILDAPKEPASDSPSTQSPSSVKTLVIVIIVILSLLLLFALFLIYWFCIRRKAPRDDASSVEELPTSPDKEAIPDTQSLASDDLDLSIRSEAY